jgi:transcriptional regulator with XRE-family HTH domain
MDNFEKVLGRVIAQKRKDAGISQEALAFRCKLHPTYISQLERGLKSPTIRVLRLIAGALSTLVSALVRDAEDAADPVLEH